MLFYDVHYFMLLCHSDGLCRFIFFVFTPFDKYQFAYCFLQPSCGVRSTNCWPDVWCFRFIDFSYSIVLFFLSLVSVCGYWRNYLHILLRFRVVCEVNVSASWMAFSIFPEGRLFGKIIEDVEFFYYKFVIIDPWYCHIHHMGVHRPSKNHNIRSQISSYSSVGGRAVGENNKLLIGHKKLIFRWASPTKGAKGWAIYLSLM